MNRASNLTSPPSIRCRPMIISTPSRIAINETTNCAHCFCKQYQMTIPSHSGFGGFPDAIKCDAQCCKCGLMLTESYADADRFLYGSLNETVSTVRKRFARPRHRSGWSIQMRQPTCLSFV